MFENCITEITLYMNAYFEAKLKNSELWQLKMLRTWPNIILAVEQDAKPQVWVWSQKY